MKWMLKVMMVICLLWLMASCKPFKQETCEFGDCDQRRLTKFAAIEQAGKIVYDNSIDKWGIESLVLGNANGRRIAFICGTLNDTFKVLNKQVVYTGNLKESCGKPRASFAEQEIYYVLPSAIR
jgi:hypothetical protein